MASDERRLRDIEERLERLERLAYLCYSEIRTVAEYAYLNVRLEHDADTIKRLPKMKALSDGEAITFGLDAQDLVALKVKARFLAARCRRDALAIGKFLADERKRRPVVQQEDEAVA